MSISSRVERLEKMVADSRKGLITVEYKDGHTELYFHLEKCPGGGAPVHFPERNPAC